jgi:Fur family transcriptional regulator, ferric uptake regulator
MKRRTWQRAAVEQALAGRDDFVSAQALHSQLRAGGSPIGLATVYRALADLADEGGADSLQSEGESLYRACVSPGHHHHLICRSCAKTVEIEADDIEEWAARVAAEHGFRDAQHVVDVFGFCEDCAAGIGRSGAY